MKSTVKWLAATFTLALPFLGAQARAGASADSVVKVFTQMRLPNPVRPWIKQNPVEVMGSGVVIDGKRILTNAHLVLYADEIFVQGGRGGDRVEAKVAAIGPGIDLAVLTLDDETFFAKRPAIARASKLPEITSRVAVQGFPIGGTEPLDHPGNGGADRVRVLRDRRGGLANPGRRRDQPGQQRWAGRRRRQDDRRGLRPCREHRLHHPQPGDRRLPDRCRRRPLRGQAVHLRPVADDGKRGAARQARRGQGRARSDGPRAETPRSVLPAQGIRHPDADRHARDRQRGDDPGGRQSPTLVHVAGPEARPQWDRAGDRAACRQDDRGRPAGQSRA